MIKLGVVAAGVIAVGLTGYGVGVGAQQSSSDLPAVHTKSPSKPEMLAIAEGTSHEAQEQIEALGLKNIIVRSVKPSDEAIASSERPTQILNYGLKYSDYDRMVETIPNIRKILPIREIKKQIRRGPNVLEGRVVGTTHDYADFNHLRIEKGRFLIASDNEKYQNYAVLAAETAERLFPHEDPLNQAVKLGSDYFTVIGVTARRAASAGIGRLAAQDFNKDAYIPLNTCRLRFGERIIDTHSGSRQAEETQLTQITLQVNSIDDVLPTVPLVRASYEKYHPMKDVEIIVPYEMLLPARQQGHARRSDVRSINSAVQSQTTVLTIVPDGSIVKKGDVLVALDSSALSNQLINQRITTRSAEAIFLNAKLAREYADHALTAYQDDLFPRDEREAKGEVEVAERELAVAQGQLELNVGGGRMVPEQAKLNVKRYELDVARAKLALEKARNRLHILTQYTRHQQTSGLDMAVKKARSDELAKGATWELEKGKEQKLERHDRRLHDRRPDRRHRRLFRPRRAGFHHSRARFPHANRPPSRRRTPIGGKIRGSKIGDSRAPLRGLPVEALIETTGAPHGRGIVRRAVARHPHPLRIRDRERVDRPAIAGAVHPPSRPVGVRGAGRAPWADGPARLPQPAPRPERRPGRLPGHVPDPGAAVGLDPTAGFGRELALRRRLPGGGPGPGRVGPPPDRRGASGRAGHRGRRAGRGGDPDREEFGPIVQEEVRRLPEKYRAAVVLCYWEGLTQEQAAAQLGCPLGTVRSRLARASDLLRRRLTRRGLEPMAVGLESDPKASATSARAGAVHGPSGFGIRGRPERRIRSSRPRWLPWSIGCSGGR